jgi:hypothetical protein
MLPRLAAHSVLRRWGMDLSDQLHEYMVLEDLPKGYGSLAFHNKCVDCVDLFSAI